MRTILAATIALVPLALVVACSSEEPPVTAPPCDNAGGAGHGGPAHAATCANFVQTLLDCEVIAGPRVSGCDDDSPVLACVWDCMQKATCVQMKSWYCGNAFNSYSGCLNECNSAPLEFTCDDGSLIDAGWQCDGVADCPHGEDESEICTQGGMFTCNSGVNIPA